MEALRKAGEGDTHQKKVGTATVECIVEDPERLERVEGRQLPHPVVCADLGTVRNEELASCQHRPFGSK